MPFISVSWGKWKRKQYCNLRTILLLKICNNGYSPWCNVQSLMHVDSSHLKVFFKDASSFLSLILLKICLFSQTHLFQWKKLQMVLDLLWFNLKCVDFMMLLKAMYIQEKPYIEYPSLPALVITAWCFLGRLGSGHESQLPDGHVITRTNTNTLHGIHCVTWFCPTVSPCKCFDHI